MLRERTTTVQLSLDDLNTPRRLTRAELMTSRQVAELLGGPVSTVLERGRNGTLPRLKRSWHVGFIRAHVEAPILEREQPRRRFGQPSDRTADWPLGWSAGR
jgi:hypothetical protein